MFAELDGTPVPEGWWPDLSDTLLTLERSIVPQDLPILAPLVAYLARHSRFLKAQAQKTAPVEAPSDIHASHPGSATLFRFRHGRSAGLERLTCIGLCALIEASESGKAAPKRLLSILRGALDSPSSGIGGALDAISSIPELVRVIETDERSQKALPPHFMQLWKSWLRSTLLRWMLDEPDRLRLALEPMGLVPQLEAPEIQVSCLEGSPEDGVAASCVSTPHSGPRSANTTSTRAARAASDQLERASAGDVLAPPDLRLPRLLDKRICRGAVVRAQDFADSDRAQAEPFVALALVLAGGIREIDLRNVAWGGEGAARPYAIDPAVPVLYRRIKRPANAVHPTQHLIDWLEPSLDVMAWPLPASVHALLINLADGYPVPGTAVLPWLAASLSSPYRLHEVISQLAPEAKVGALAPRLALASEISASLGTEMAQLSMADTFSMSSIPAYYSALPETDLAECIARIQSGRFGEHVGLHVRRAGYVGSRLVLTDTAARRWSGHLRHPLQLASRQPGNWLAAWLAHRNHLAAVLCSATGHRPEDALGRIFLGDVIPEYGLVILQDKQVDALRAARIAATGRLWLADLRRYLDRLITISVECAGEPAGKLAAAILRCEEPLFSVPTQHDSTSPMTASALRDGMPPELQKVDNFFRHRLNQCLQARNVDPELRHAQLGWVVSPAHFNADLSPRAPVDLGRNLGPIIDDLLVADGWYLPSTRKTRWIWDGVPMPTPVDWGAVFTSHKRQHEEALKRVRLQLRERWKEHEGPVMARLGEAIREFSPLLHIDQEKKCLAQIEGVEGAVALGPDQHALICDRVRQGDQDPTNALEAVIARIMLYRLVRRAREKGIVQGPIPSRPYLSVTADPSPFVPGLGIAVRQAHAIRRALEARASTGSVRDQGQMTVWSILAFSMYRRLSWAHAATGVAKSAMRAKGRSHVVRIAARIEDTGMHMIFSGVPAILLSRRKRHAPTAQAPSADAIEAWAVAHLSESVPWGKDGAASARIESTLLAAAQVELSGIERSLFRAGPHTAADSPIRCIARDDDWPVHTADTMVGTEGMKDDVRDPPFAETPPATTAQVAHRTGYARLAGLLNKRTFGQLRASKATKAKSASDGKHGWRGALKNELVKLQSDTQRQWNLSVLIAYVLDHLRYGSEDGNRLSQNSLRREVTQIGWPLLTSLEDRSLLALTAEELRQLYREILLSKSTQARPYAFEEIQRLHRYLVRVHARPSVDMSELASFAGNRQLRIEPGLLTQAERTATYGALHLDYETEAKRPEANPEFLRLTEARLIFFLVLEASGIRPGSAYGLTLADLHFLGEASDVVHVRTTGDYGEAKTTTSVGFIPLCSPLWALHREWVRAWIEEQRVAQLNGQWRELPLFAVRLGHRVRVHEHHLTARINALLKWASGNRRAHCYWLRKVCISERFQALQCMSDVTARDVYGAMMVSGHALIQITIERYINDPASLLFADLRAASEAPRSALLGVSGLVPGPVDMAWSRSSGNAVRTGIVLDRLDADFALAEAEYRTEPPPLRRFKPFLPAHVDAYARAMHRYRNRPEAVLAAGVTAQQADQLDKVATQLFILRGCAPWRLSEQQSRRVSMPVPRRLAGSEKWFRLLEKEPSKELESLAASWVQQAHASRLFGKGVVMRLEAAQLLTVSDLLEMTGLKMQLVASGGHHLLLGLSNDANANGHMAAMRWVLSLVWIHNSMSGHT